MLPTIAPYQIYTDLNGSPLDEGSIYYGVANANPVTSPVPVFWDLAGTQPIAQPIKTLSGYPVRFGTPTNVYTATTYSVSAYDKKGRLVFYAPDSSQYDRLATYVSELADQTDPDKGSALIGFLRDAAGAEGRTVHSKLSDTVSLRDFGAVGDGVTNDRQALVAAFADSSLVEIPAGVYRISTNTTLGPATQLKFHSGATLSIDTGVTLTINGIVEAGWEQLFTGLGSVVGLRTVRGEWFGANNAGTGDSQPAFTKAMACIMGSAGSSGDVEIQLQSGNYRLASSLILTPTASFNLRMVGGGSVFGTTFTAASTFAGSILLVIQGQLNASNDRIADYNIGGFRLALEVGSSVTTGLWVGGTTSALSLIGVGSSKIENVYIDQFPIGLNCNQLRLCTFSRVRVWHDTVNNSIGLNISAEANDFTGDLDFDRCQFTSALTATGSRNVKIAHLTAGQIKGLHFHRCIFYKAPEGVNITAQGTAQVGDIWFESCQFDGNFGTSVITTNAVDAGTVLDDIHIVNSYARGGSGYFLFMNKDASAEVRCIFVQGNWIADFACGATGLMDFTGTKGLNISGNIMEECSSAVELIRLLSAPQDTVISGNVVRRRSVGFSLAFALVSASSDGYNIVNNMTTAGTYSGTYIQDNSASVRKTLTGNV